MWAEESEKASMFCMFYLETHANLALIARLHKSQREEGRGKRERDRGEKERGKREREKKEKKNVPGESSSISLTKHIFNPLASFSCTRIHMHQCAGSSMCTRV